MLNDLNTPCYIIDQEHLENNIMKMQTSFRNNWNGGVVFGYSVKTNSLPWLLSFMRQHGYYAEVVSEQEYRLAKTIGFPVSEVIINGPIKSEELLLDVLNGGAYVNIDNFEEIKMLGRILHKKETEWKIGLRYNFILEKQCPGETITGYEYSRFGFNIENGSFGRAVELIEDMEGISISGLHGHNSTKTKSLGVFKAIAKTADMLINEYKLDLEYIDIGGGFWGDKPGAPDYEDYARVIADSITDKSVKLILEPGASLISSPVSYLSTVMNIREVEEKRFVTLDGSTVHIDPLFHNIQFAKKIYGSGSEIYKGEQTLCGFTCIEMDRMGIVENDKLLSVGDRILFLNCGSYSMTLSPLFINYFPDVYVSVGGKYSCVRKAWDEDIFMQNNRSI